MLRPAAAAAATTGRLHKNQNRWTSVANPLIVVTTQWTSVQGDPKSSHYRIIIKLC